jgi:hypothetical protein
MLLGLSAIFFTQLDKDIKLVSVQDAESEQRLSDKKDCRRMQNCLAQRAFRVRSTTNRVEACLPPLSRAVWLLTKISQAVAHLKILAKTAQDQASRLDSMRGLVQQLRSEKTRLEAVNLEIAEESDLLRVYILANWGGAGFQQSLDRSCVLSMGSMMVILFACTHCPPSMVSVNA